MGRAAISGFRGRAACGGRDGGGRGGRTEFVASQHVPRDAGVGAGVAGRGATRRTGGGAAAAAATQPSGVAAASAGQWLPAPPAVGRERKRVDHARARAAGASRPAHAASQKQPARRARRAAQGSGPVASLSQPSGAQPQRELLPRGARLGAGAARPADPQPGRQPAAEHPGGDREPAEFRMFISWRKLHQRNPTRISKSAFSKLLGTV